MSITIAIVFKKIRFFFYIPSLKLRGKASENQGLGSMIHFFFAKRPIFKCELLVPGSVYIYTYLPASQNNKFFVECFFPP